MAYIIDTYNKYDVFDREHSQYIFEVNGTQYAIKKVQLKWGKPRLPLSTTHNKEQEPYHIYETFEEALQFAHNMRSIN